MAAFWSDIEHACIANQREEKKRTRASQSVCEERVEPSEQVESEELAEQHVKKDEVLEELLDYRISVALHPESIVEEQYSFLDTQLSSPCVHSTVQVDPSHPTSHGDGESPDEQDDIVIDHEGGRAEADSQPTCDDRVDGGRRVDGDAQDSTQLETLGNDSWCGDDSLRNWVDHLLSGDTSEPDRGRETSGVHPSSGGLERCRSEEQEKGSKRSSALPLPQGGWEARSIFADTAPTPAGLARGWLALELEPDGGHVPSSLSAEEVTLRREIESGAKTFPEQSFLHDCRLPSACRLPFEAPKAPSPTPGRIF